MWSFEKFHDFCAPSLTQFYPPSSVHSIDRLSIIESIISYPNEVGYIIYIPNLHYIIVDPNWLLNTFLGELIALGQHFEAQEFESSDRTSSQHREDGFVSESVFAGFIEEFLGKKPHQQRGVDKEVLENILVNLDLCFKLKDTSHYFITSFIREYASMEIQNHIEEMHVESMHWKNRGDTPHFVGIWMQRWKNNVIVFFPRFHVRLDHDLIYTLEVLDVSICDFKFLMMKKKFLFIYCNTLFFKFPTQY